MTTKWDIRFLENARLIGRWSKDPSTKVGCVVVDPDKNQLSSGFNGLPRGVEDTPERLNNREVKYKIVCHAEANAIASAARNGHSLKGSILYTTCFPCAQCAALIIQAGIGEVVYTINRDYEARWADDVALAHQIFQEAGVFRRAFDPDYKEQEWKATGRA
jgi:dCMP deaminase